MLSLRRPENWLGCRNIICGGSAPKVKTHKSRQRSPSATTDLVELSDRLKATTEGAIPKLAVLCVSCGEVADELLTGLARLKRSSTRGAGKAKSVRLALRSMWSKDKIAGIERRLSGFRDEINLHIVVEIR